MKNEFDYLNDVKMDFSCYEEESFIEKERHTMKNKRRIILIAACIAALTITTAFASGIVGNIIKSVNTGYNEFVLVDPDAPTPLMDELKGKIFDENGIPVDSIKHSDFGNLYDKYGKKITQDMYASMIEEATDGLVAYSGNYNPEESQIVFASLEDAQAASAFDIKTPDYLPEGYSLSKVYTYKGDNSNYYITLVYANDSGNDITIHERLLNEETAFELGTDGSLDEITINGRTAVIINGHSLDFETEDSVYVGISSNISRDELIKIGESIK